MLARHTGDAKRIQPWAIVASALGIAYASLTGLAFLPFAIGLGFAEYSDKWIQVCSLFGLIPANLYVAFAAAAIRKRDLTRRIAYPTLATIGAVIVLILGVWEHGRYDERRMENYVESQLAEQEVIEEMNNVLACLENYSAMNSGQGYPESLEETAGVRGCSAIDTNPREIAGYSFRYEPARKQLGSGKAVSFRFEARPPETWSHQAYPYAADPAGIIYQRTQYGVRPRGGSDGAYLLSYIRRCASEVAKANQGQDIDSVLQGLQNTCYTAPGQSSGRWQNENGTLLFRMTSSTVYAVEVQLTEAEDRPTATITGSARCNNYAMDCLRSYFMDESGAVHGTPEPRLATVYDPLAPPCESSSTPCNSLLVK